ncbi:MULTISPECIES: ATP-binding protein [unclassified Streptomyces]|uniref:ATP-binding protein n=1 Tax=Streptomyces sp. NPDC127129 TaxID=3345373 RepID=UPI003626489D
MLTATAPPAPRAPAAAHTPARTDAHDAGPGRATTDSTPHAPTHPTQAFVRWIPGPTAATVPLVRSRVRVLLEGWRITSDATDTLLLAVSELVGNVVRHAAAATDRMRVAVSRGEGWLRLEVADGAATAPRLREPAEVDPDSESGRGLLLIQLMTAEAGGELSVLVHDLGKCVRVRLPLA